MIIIFPDVTLLVSLIIFVVACVLAGFALWTIVNSRKIVKGVAALVVPEPEPPVATWDTETLPLSAIRSH